MKCKTGDRVLYKWTGTFPHEWEGRKGTVVSVSSNCEAAVVRFDDDYTQCNSCGTHNLVPLVELDLTKPLQTQDGRGVKFLDTLCGGAIVGIVKSTSDTGEFAYTWQKDGRPQVGSLPGLQLVNVPPPKVKKEQWWYLYRTTGGKVFGYKSGRDDWFPPVYPKTTIIAKKQITIEEGEGMGSMQQGCGGNCTSSCKCK